MSWSDWSGIGLEGDRTGGESDWRGIGLDGLCGRSGPFFFGHLFFREELMVPYNEDIMKRMATAI